MTKTLVFGIQNILNQISLKTNKTSQQVCKIKPKMTSSKSNIKKFQELK